MTELPIYQWRCWLLKTELLPVMILAINRTGKQAHCSMGGVPKNNKMEE